jgi:putative ABC transport system ATP-binding protein
MRVSRTYRSPAGSIEAVHAVDAHLPAGALSAVVGPSGAGKSTLMRMIAAVDPVDGGTIRAGDVDVAALDTRAARRYRRDCVTYLAQRAAANLVPHLTVAEQLGADGEALVDALDLRHRAHARAGELSGGEQARAALAVGLSRRTPFVLVDEPTAELDDAAAARAVDVLRRAAAAGRTVVVATHDAAVVDAADAVVTLAPPIASASQRRLERPPPGEPPAVVLDGIRKSFRGVPAVDDASLTLRRGELGVLLGRSGSGKSTLLMIAGGWTPADAGRAAVPGAAANGPPQWRQTAYVAQRFGLLPELSVAENVALPLRVANVRNDARVSALLDTLALTELRERLPSETSIGQQQRTALARALVVRPAALLADEPTSHQDAGSAERIWAALTDACADGTACLVATHDETAATRAHRVWRIDDGHVTSDG